MSLSGVVIRCPEPDCEEQVDVEFTRSTRWLGGRRGHLDYEVNVYPGKCPAGHVLHSKAIDDAVATEVSGWEDYVRNG